MDRSHREFVTVFLKNELVALGQRFHATAQKAPQHTDARIDAVDRVHRDSGRLLEPMERQDDGEDSAEEPGKSFTPLARNAGI